MAANPKHLMVFAPLFLAGACGDAGQDGAIGARGTLEGPDVMLDAVTEEVFTVGSVVGDAWDTFGSVSSVAFDREGNLHIFDSQAEHILVVGRDGSLLRTVGGQGEGPGEFGNVSSAIVARDGSYTVLSFSQVDLFDPGGIFVRRVQMDAILFSGLALPDGRLVASGFVSMDASSRASSSPDDGGRPIHVIPLDGTEPEILYTAWVLPEDADDDNFAVDSSRTIRISAGRAFEPGLYYDVLTDGRLALADSIGYRVKLIGLDGSVTGVVERPIAPLAVDEAIMEAERERYRESTAQLQDLQSSFRVEREGVEELDFADEVPVIGDVEVDWEDRIWVTRRAADGDRDGGPTDIVTPDGRYIGTLAADGLQTPGAFGPDGLLAYIERDELDVPTVRVIRLVSLEPEG
ncbi:6-bladed beta-propeller [Candidatus Palauibacter sp.]|uniref:6-bladed beta-propeller n=1 Tax=Candidatus Palauibacter sp. TaxID=3101350 RepID=UPI003B5228B0